MGTFDPVIAEAKLRERIESLENDTLRCFWKIDDGPGPAFFPAVLYAYATIDYLSSCWAGWNDSKGNRSKNQTMRMATFLEKYCRYGKRECQIAVSLWRHKLMHTGEPRVLRNAVTNEVYKWEIDSAGKSHMELVPLSAPGEFGFQVNPLTLVQDLRAGVLGAGGYLAELRQSPDLQQMFLDFMQETESYNITLRE